MNENQAEIKAQAVETEMKKYFGDKNEKDKSQSLFTL